MTEPSTHYSGHKATVGALEAIGIADALATHTRCKAIYIGSGDDYEFYVGGAWISFLGAVSGSVIPVQAKGARHTNDTAPDAGDIIFLY